MRIDIVSRFSVLAALAIVVAACTGQGSADDVVETTAQATSCAPKLALYPVRAKHNNGYDRTAGDMSKWTCDDANSNSDYNGTHLGNDIWAPDGAPLAATVDGTLALVGFTAYSGNKLTIVDRCGWYHFYTHLKGFAPGIANGKRVKAGDVVGYVGKTGTSSNGVVHLHYSIYPDGNYNQGIDPWKYLHEVEQKVCMPGAVTPEDGGALEAGSNDAGEAGAPDAGIEGPQEMPKETAPPETVPAEVERMLPESESGPDPREPDEEERAAVAPPAVESSGCSVASRPASGLAALGGLVLAGVAVVLRRARRARRVEAR